LSAESLANTLDLHRADERRQALRALLMRPQMTARDAGFAAVRRHADALRPWLQRETGWVLHVERDGARLFKRPADLTDGTRGAPEMDRRRYILLCLACGALERAEAQITLRGLGEDLIRLASTPELGAAGYHFGLDQASERRDLVQVCRFLIDWGVLSRVVGDEEAFVSHKRGENGDALYDVHRRVLAGLLACARGPSTFAPGTAPDDIASRLHALVDEFVADGAEARRTAVRHALARRLLDDPVVYFDELDSESREYFANQRGPLCSRLAEASGLTAEQRAEGAALIDADGELSDARLPAEGTLSHATLLVAEYLANALSGAEQRSIAETEVAVFLRRAADEYGRYWRKAEREPGAEVSLGREVLQQLRQLRLILWKEGAVRARPALARFALGEPELRTSERPSKRARSG
jgi:uncharacterized protein (TIGR02678 family)